MKQKDPRFWCDKHECDKVWMVQSSFCPQCEVETYGDMGRVEPPDLWESLTEELELDDEVTEEILIDVDPWFMK